MTLKILFGLALLVLLALGLQRIFFSFSAQSPEEDAGTAPAFDPPKHLVGNMISEAGPGCFTATVADIVGEATVEYAGAALRMRCRLRLDETAGGHVLDVNDWRYLAPNGTILNRSEMHKVGVKVAELVAKIRPAS